MSPHYSSIKSPPVTIVATGPACVTYKWSSSSLRHKHITTVSRKMPVWSLTESNNVGATRGKIVDDFLTNNFLYFYFSNTKTNEARLA